MFQYDEILMTNGKLCLMKGGAGRTYPCPFAYPEPCGEWCPHFGEIQKVGKDTYHLRLGCCGTHIEAKAYHVTNFDETKGSVGVGHPVHEYKEISKPAGKKQRMIAWSETFRYANLIKVYNQCCRKKKQKSSEEDK